MEHELAYVDMVAVVLRHTRHCISGIVNNELLIISFIWYAETPVDGDVILLSGLFQHSCELCYTK